MDSAYLKNGNGFVYQREELCGAAVYRCSGPMVLNVHLDLDQMILAAEREGVRRIVLELTAVTRIDSVGVGTLAKILRAAMAAGRLLVVVANPVVREALAQASLDGAFHFAESMESALRDPFR